MSQVTEETRPPAPETDAPKKPGLLGRLFEKVDSAMKAKADKASDQTSCCSGTDGKGNKCC